MILDDGFPGYDTTGDGREAKGSGKLRFMVVIGMSSRSPCSCIVEANVDQ